MKKILGSVGGGVGLLLLLFTTPITYFTVDSVVPSIIALVLGILGVGLWGITAGDRAGNWARSAFFYSSSVGLLVAFVGLLIGINVIAAKRAPSWDLTTNHIFSLRPQTLGVLKGLQHPVKAIAFVKGSTPEPIEALFRKYAEANEQFTFEFKDPQRNPDLTQRYQIREGQPAAVLTFVSGGQETHTILNLSRLGNPQFAESELTNGLVKLEAVGTQKLYFVIGHQEIPLDAEGQTEEAMAASLMGLKRMLQDDGYAPQALNLLERGEVPKDASALVIAGARSKFGEPEKKMLEAYLAEGGRLLYFAEAGSEPDLGGAPRGEQHGRRVEAHGCASGVEIDARAVAKLNGAHRVHVGNGDLERRRSEASVVARALQCAAPFHEEGRLAARCGEHIHTLKATTRSRRRAKTMEIHCDW